MSVARSIICICTYLIAAGRKENKKVTFATFTLTEIKASNWKLLELQMWRAFVRIWIRRSHNLLTTLSGGNGGRWERGGQSERARMEEWRQAGRHWFPSSSGQNNGHGWFSSHQSLVTVIRSHCGTRSQWCRENVCGRYSVRASWMDCLSVIPRQGNQ